QLIWAISMQNHGFYEDKAYETADYDSIQYRLPAHLQDAEQEQLLKNYLIGARDADLLLGRLVDHFSDYDQPVILAFFGDHWPYWQGGDFVRSLLPDNLSTLEESIAIHQTPFLLWSNYHQVPEDLGIISGSLVAPLVARQSCLPLPPFWEMLDYHRQFLTGYNLGINVLADGSLVIDDDLPADLLELKNNHWLWQYDLLFGRQYSLSP
ncbi:sulfatase-like hydrolase/transferase, partial [Microgenomates group bacterium]|nr:sulfatase-like hydrolase/transferase [Microgenomates group bacterium]